MHSAVTKLSETVKGSQVHPQTSVLAFIRLPVVNARKQNRPTRTAKEIEKIITRPGIGISCLAYRVPISRFSWPLLAPRDILGGLQTGFSLPARRPGQYAYRHLRSKRANDSRPERVLPQTRRSEPDPLFPHSCCGQNMGWSARAKTFVGSVLSNRTQPVDYTNLSSAPL